ncbi:MAG TPA: mannonate dehydratase [Acidimicrobiia bacterium]|nr:mannonate dehydratase [Acidimicrobiia bacterium]
MKLASVLNPLSDHNLALAAQAGVEEIVIRCPGRDLSAIDQMQEKVEAFGMRVGVVEGGLPLDAIKLGRDDGSELEAFEALVRHLGARGIPIVCYNFMAGTDWIRTTVDAPERGGALVTGFRLTDVEKARIPGRDPYGEEGLERGADRNGLWKALEGFLTEIVPVAEEAGVVLAMHPDDPPLPHLLGNDRIMYDVDAFERLVNLVPSPSNAIAFCQGTFSEMGIDIPATIRRLGSHIAYVHFRDVRGTAEDFVETWQDNGQTDMVEAMRAYREVGFTGPMRPDHVPQMDGEQGTPGYTMLGRLYAYGYIRGLIQATESGP